MSSVNPPEGSRWRRWDLHIHTPESVVNGYDGDDPWKRFLEDLRALPEGQVIGINDYIFVDGYERVLKAFTDGDLPNIAAVFPVVELRLANLVGTHGHLNRINAHVLFSNEIEPDTIRGQFINGLSSEYKLDPELDTTSTWSGLPDRDNLASLGAAIKSSIPEDRIAEFGESDLALGFNNLVVSFEDIKQRLDHSAFHKKAILAVGKTEWEALEWNEKSIAIKKDVVNSAHLVFTAAPDLKTYQKGRTRLRESGVNDRLIDCSDAHFFSDSPQKDRIGNCMTWINADPTFDGLLHAITEFEDRVYVGPEPPKLGAVRERSDSHLAAVRLAPTASNAGHKYFDVELPLNPGFVAVVGNKGQGKSALLDAIGLATASRNEEHYTFLHPSRFRNPLNNLARAYVVDVEWVSGETSSVRLDTSLSADAPERSTYLPQDLIDILCTAEPGDAAAKQFTAELEKVLYAHVPESERLGSGDLASLIRAKTSQIESRTQGLRKDLRSLNAEIATLERTSRPERRAELESKLRLVKRQLAEHDGKEPAPPTKPPSIEESEELQAISQSLDGLRSQRSKIVEEKKSLEVKAADLAKRIDAARQLLTAIETIQNQLTEAIDANRERAHSIGLDIEDLISIRIDDIPLRKALSKASGGRRAVLEKINGDQEGSLRKALADLDDQIAATDDQLRGPAKDYADELKQLLEWQKVRERLAIGTEDDPGVKLLNERLGQLDKIPGLLGTLRQRRLRKVGEIHDALLKVVEIYRELYEPALNFIENHPIAKQAQLSFSVDLQVRDLDQRFWDLHGRNVVGTFQGVEDGAKELTEMTKRTDFMSLDDTQRFVTEVDDALHKNKRDGADVDPEKAIRTGYTLEELYDLVFGLEYLEPTYSLEYSGTPIDKLSPGEKGTLLLMFYLLVDQSVTPLLLDQPDENLDNQTIKELLVPAIKEARQRRQVITVTHNPNVAVVADADQIIAAQMIGDSFRYESGSIESRRINTHVVDVLEGTWPAITNRNEKYRRPE